MREDVRNERWLMGGGALVLLLVLVPLWDEFREPANTVWNIFLAILLMGLAVGSFFLQRYLRSRIGEIGEARFDTRNKSDG